MINENILDEFEKNEIHGQQDSSLYHLEDLMFCDIPSYLDLDNFGNSDVTDDEIDNLLDELEKNVDDIFSNLYKGNSDKGYIENTKKVIIEFASKTPKYNAEPYIWNVKPGETINSDTIIAYCQQKGKMIPVKSIFKSGIVRKDETDNDFWRCYKTVSSRHIVIDDAVKSSENFESSFNTEMISDFDYEFNEHELMQNYSDVITNFSDSLQNAQDAFDLLRMYYPYTLYLKYLVFKGKKKTNPLLPTINPENVFQDFVKDVYEPLRDSLNDELLKVYGGKKNVQKRLKSTKGDINKLRKISEEIINVKNNHFEKIVAMISNFQNELSEYHYRPFKTETCIFNKGFTYKFGLFEDDEMNIDENTTETSMNIHEEESVQKFETFNEYIYRLDKSILNTKKPLVVEFKNLLKKIQNESISKDDIDFIDASISSIYGSNFIQKIETINNLDASTREIVLSQYGEKIKSIDQTDKLQRWVHDLDEFFEKCIKTYRDFLISDIPEDISNSQNNSYLSNFFQSNFKEFAIWPEFSKEYFYEPTNETFDEHYVFLNIDEMNAFEDGDFEWNDEYDEDNDFSESDLNTSLNQMTDDFLNDPLNGIDLEEEFNKESEVGKDMEPDKMPSIDSHKYWLRYCGLATLVTLPFLATGIPLPFMSCIPLPCIYIPLTTIKMSKIGIITVIGLAIRGVSISPFVIVINLDSKKNSYIFPIPLAIVQFKELIQKSVDEIISKLEQSITKKDIEMKSIQIAMMKEEKEQEHRLSALKSVKTPGQTNFIDNFKDMSGTDKRQIINRIGETNLVSPSIS